MPSLLNTLPPHLEALRERLPASHLEMHERTWRASQAAHPLGRPSGPAAIDHWLWCARGLRGLVAMVEQLAREGLPASDAAMSELDGAMSILQEIVARQREQPAPLILSDDESSADPLTFDTGENARKPATRAGPSILQKAASLAIAAVKHAAGGGPTVSEEEYERRIGICRTCSHFDATKTICDQCGCYLQIKARWVSGECPLEKWRDASS